jgi:hypothetical protein
MIVVIIFDPSSSSRCPIAASVSLLCVGSVSGLLVDRGRLPGSIVIIFVDPPSLVPILDFVVIALVLVFIVVDCIVVEVVVGPAVVVSPQSTAQKMELELSK